MIKTYTYILLLSFPVLCFSQTTEQVIQLSGMVLKSNSGKGLPYAHIIIKNRLQGSICDFEGVFSLPVANGDTIRFSSMGYHETTYIVPDIINVKHHSIDQDLEQDTLRDFVVFRCFSLISFY